jgi:microcystin-dependent protein
MQMYAGATAPNSDWLICDGSEVSRTTYATLYAVIGTTFGTGNGSTTFNIPDMRSRMPIGVGTGTGLSARTLAQTSGAETQTIGSANLPTHTHTLSAHTHTSAAHTHTLGGHTHGSAAHTHTLPRATIGTAGTNRLVLSNSPTDNALTTGSTTPGSTGGPSTDSGSTTPGDTGAPSSDTTGNGGFANTALSIMNPFLALNFIIKV